MTRKTQTFPAILPAPTVHRTPRSGGRGGGPIRPGVALLMVLMLVSCPAPPREREGFQLMEATLPRIQNALETGLLTSRQLVELYLARIRAFDQQGPALNAIAAINEQALAEADALDAERTATGPRGPLHGIPVIVKDNLESAGLQTASGSLSLEGWIPPHDAVLVKRLREAGAILLAKANLHEFAMGTTTVGSLFGQTRNPYAPDRNPGGSSGGTGAAIAANFAAVGLGTDTCSSIRNPSSHNSLVGLRGTQGLASRSGILPLSHTQDMGGPMGRSVTDVAILLDAIAGYDPADPQTAASVGRIPESYTHRLRTEGLEGSRIGLLPQLMPSDPGSAVTALVQRAVEELKGRGAAVLEVEIPGLEELMENPLLVAVHETREDLQVYFEQHPSAPVRSLAEILASGRYHPAIESRLRERQEIAAGSEEYRRHLWKRTLLRRAVLTVMADARLDALAYPSVLEVASRLGEPGAGSNGCFSANSGLPAITVPAGFSAEGLPVGLELMGRAWSEARLIELAYSYEQATQHRRPPGATPPLPESR